ncbi:cytochrome P450 [Crucibulum laeve]|uniref:Cytochrome P450 n=1 Tax=Crucibulum laeve TaxID=68775 RepID=A0A5C3MB08_9AGAR|nr:cytochrome P450 [Crucibulum laeve]
MAIGFLVVSLLLTFYYRHLRKRRNLPLPPGPKKLPLIGNLLDVPAEYEWKQYTSWGEEFGSDIIHLDVAGKSIIVLNSVETAHDLLDYRSAIYSSRPISTMVSELIGWKWLFGFIPYNRTWRERRRQFQQHLGRSNTSIHEPRELHFAHILLQQLLNSPENFMEHIRHMTGAITLSIAYGIDLKHSNDPVLVLAEKAQSNMLSAAIPGKYLVDAFPILRHVPEWIPGAGFQKKAKEMKKEMIEYMTVPFEMALERVEQGTVEPSFISLCLDSPKGGWKTSEDELLSIKATAGQIFMAGADTSVAALNTFILAMTCFPEKQKKAQEELDRVLMGRLPDHSDISQLPYVQAIVKEVLRWQPVLPGGFAHYLIEDDEYLGYHIPAESIIIFNSWAMSRNEEDYPDPENFLPERFIKDGRLISDITDPLDFSFGFGRRICPGKHIALTTISITIASILTAFSIVKPIDKDGNIVHPSREYTSSPISHPVLFKCSIKPRSREALALIRSLSPVETM